MCLWQPIWTKENAESINKQQAKIPQKVWKVMTTCKSCICITYVSYDHSYHLQPFDSTTIIAKLKISRWNWQSKVIQRKSSAEGGRFNRTSW